MSETIAKVRIMRGMERGLGAAQIDSEKSWYIVNWSLVKQAEIRGDGIEAGGLETGFA